LTGIIFYTFTSYGVFALLVLSMSSDSWAFSFYFRNFKRWWNSQLQQCLSVCVFILISENNKNLGLYLSVKLGSSSHFWPFWSTFFWILHIITILPYQYHYQSCFYVFTLSLKATNGFHHKLLVSFHDSLLKRTRTGFTVSFVFSLFHLLVYFGNIAMLCSLQSAVMLWHCIGRLSVRLWRWCSLIIIVFNVLKIIAQT